MADCPHGMPSPGACIDCMAEGGLPRPKLKRDGWPFIAKYDGTCGGCLQPIESDGARLIVRMSDETYRHVGQCEKVHRG